MKSLKIGLKKKQFNLYFFYYYSGIAIRESNSRLHLDDNGSKLRLTSLEMSDTANYSCHAKNLYGQDSITYTLTVKCKKRKAF